MKTFPTSISTSGLVPTEWNPSMKMSFHRSRSVSEKPIVDGEKSILDLTEKMEAPLSKQVGGSHYKNYSIQPIEYAMANGLNYCQANAIKYITRYRDKNGIEDLRKAIHNIEILIELEENGRIE